MSSYMSTLLIPFRIIVFVSTIVSVALLATWLIGDNFDPTRVEPD